MTDRPFAAAIAATIPAGDPELANALRGRIAAHCRAPAEATQAAERDT